VYGPVTGKPSLTKSVGDKNSRLSMQTIMYHATTVAVLAVFIVLMLGLYTMMRGTSPSLSQKLMRWRVGLQFVAIIVIMAAVYVKKHLA
jgi:Hypoxia induced protein conserved region